MVDAITEMVRNGRRRKSRRGQGATAHDLCFAANIRKTMEAITSGLECVEKSGKILHWTEASVVLSGKRLEARDDVIGGATTASDQR